MLFNSLHFFVFFPVTVLLFYLLKPKFRPHLLLAASWYFYAAWKPEYLLLVLASVLTDYFCTLKMGHRSSPGSRKPFLLLSISVNLALLFTFKYLGFFTETVADVVAFFTGQGFKPLSLLLPVGISFYTFQTLSYSVEVWKGTVKPEKNFVVFALYVSFFPQLVAGPIERPQDLLPQLRNRAGFNFDHLRKGCFLMLWGFFMKVVIADNAAFIADKVFAEAENYYGLPMALGAVAFWLQIYGDFAGYSFIAVGLACVMGIRLRNNFSAPYFSKSLSEFWKRWHITLSFWFRDYIYIPLGGNRSVKWRRGYNLLLTFLLSGLWHGAAWNFLIWGGVHGLFVLLEKQFPEPKPKTIFEKAIRVLLLNLFLMGTWIIFRIENIEDLKHFALRLPINFSVWMKDVFWTFKRALDTGSPTHFLGYFGAMYLTDFFLIFKLLTAGTFLFTIEFLTRKQTISKAVLSTKPVYRSLLYITLLLMILFFGAFFERKEFIYFRF